MAGLLHDSGWFAGAGGCPKQLEITNSLRFRGAQSLQGPSYTRSGVGGVSMWVKRGKLGTDQSIYDRNEQASLIFTSGDAIRTRANVGGGQSITTELFRDPGAWYHIFIEYLADNRFNTYINGQFLQYNNNGIGTAAFNTVLGANYAQGGTFFDGYMAEVYGVFGRAPLVTEFGTTNADGVWVPLKPGFALADYGASGFYLDFSDPLDIGADRSGNGNDFNATGFELVDASDVEYDWMADSPTDNFSTLNPLDNAGLLLVDANLTGNTDANRSATTMVAPVTSGKYYVEFEVIANGNGLYGVGAAAANKYYPSEATGMGVFYTANTGSITLNGAVVTGGAGYSGGAVVGMAFDMDAAQRTVQFFLNGVNQGTAVNLFDTPLGWVPVIQATSASTGGARLAYNAGNRPFAYPPGSSTPTTSFNTVLWTGNGSTQAVTGVGFAPDLVWIKNRDVTDNHWVGNTVVGATKALNASTADAEITEPNGLTSFDADGFSLGSEGLVNRSGNDFVAWCWKEDPANGFDVVTYTADGSGTLAVPHNLGVAPDFFMVKSRTAGGAWRVWTKDIPNNTYLALDLPNGHASNTWINSVDASNITFSGTGGDYNIAGREYVIYAWADTTGKVKTGSYVGNGTTDGPFVSTGFSPAMVMTKSSSSGNWIIIDNVRDTVNPRRQWLRPNTNGVEGNTSPDLSLDFFPTGFKIKNNSTDQNLSGTTYYFIAFGENFVDEADGLSTDNLSEVAITDPSDHFTTILDTGANILTNAQAQVPSGLWWIKDRANSNQHQLVDSVRGGNLVHQLPAQPPDVAYVAPAGNSVGWCWNASDAFTNTAGDNGASLASSGQRNAAAGFSIVEYTGNNVAGASVFHGLSEAPELMIVKSRDASLSGGGGEVTVVYHVSEGATKYGVLNTNAAFVASATPWNNVAPTSQVFTVGIWNATNGNGSDTIAYCWHSVPGYSAFGSYQANLNADGPFIYTGFRPAFLLIKNVSANTSWYLVDGERQTYNPVNLRFSPNNTNPEGSFLLDTDLLSNGFKIRAGSPTTDYGDINSGTHIYAAFAEHPFGGSNCGLAPSPAR